MLTCCQAALAACLGSEGSRGHRARGQGPKVRGSGAGSAGRAGARARAAAARPPWVHLGRRQCGPVHHANSRAVRARTGLLRTARARGRGSLALRAQPAQWGMQPIRAGALCGPAPPVTSAGTLPPSTPLPPTERRDPSTPYILPILPILPALYPPGRPVGGLVHMARGGGGLAATRLQG